MTKQAYSPADPRINSPEIKVVYPSVIDLSKEPVITGGVKAPEPLVAPLKAVDAQSEVVTEPTPAVQQNSPVQPLPKKWTDTLKENATLFIAIALIGLVTGILIGKKL